MGFILILKQVPVTADFMDLFENVLLLFLTFFLKGLAGACTLINTDNYTTINLL